MMMCPFKYSLYLKQVLKSTPNPNRKANHTRHKFNKRTIIKLVTIIRDLLTYQLLFYVECLFDSSFNSFLKYKIIIYTKSLNLNKLYFNLLK